MWTWIPSEGCKEIAGSLTRHDPNYLDRENSLDESLGFFLIFLSIIDELAAAVFYQNMKFDDITSVATFLSVA